MLKRFNTTMLSSKRNEGKSSGAVYSSLSPSLDTTLFKTNVRPKLKRTKRKIINDRDISPSLFEKLKKKCQTSCVELKQKNIIEVLYELNLSNVTIARVINDLVEGANATQGSVASMIRFLKTSQTSQKMAQELDKLLEDDL